MQLRSLTNGIAGFNFYESSFDPLTGTIVRTLYRPTHSKDRWGLRRLHSLLQENGMSLDDTRKAVSLYLEEHGFDRAKQAWSPVPETIDIQITNRCVGMSCSYCYQDSTPEEKDKDALSLVERVFDSLSDAPYQIAYGGGEPCLHPDFPKILRRTRELGSVPNFTTAGHIFRKGVIQAANEVCGGIALTYHRHKGIRWFSDTYKRWKEALRFRPHIHVLCGGDVVSDLKDLIEALGNDIHVVLLAYYADVGRSDHSGVLTKQAYHRELPLLLKGMVKRGSKVAYSEGMLPYFLSRPDILPGTSFAGRSEGLYSCYVDAQGRVSRSSFEPPMESRPTIWEKCLQDQWDSGYWPMYSPGANPCSRCKIAPRCHAPQDIHILPCAYQDHNQD